MPNDRPGEPHHLPTSRTAGGWGAERVVPPRIPPRHPQPAAVRALGNKKVARECHEIFLENCGTACITFSRPLSRVPVFILQRSRPAHLVTLWAIARPIFPRHPQRIIAVRDKGRDLREVPPVSLCPASSGSPARICRRRLFCFIGFCPGRTRFLPHIVKNGCRDKKRPKNSIKRPFPNAGFPATS